MISAPTITSATVQGGLRLLVVDAAPALPDALEEMAVALGYELVQCHTMAHGFTELARFQPHVAIVDPETCELGGIGVVRAIRLLAPDCEVILTEVDSTSDFGLEAVRAGALECMTKRASLLRLKEILLRAATRMSKTQHIVPHAFDVAFRLDGETATRYGRFTSVESRGA